MKIQVNTVTCGNEVLFETLDSFKANIKVPYELFVFYHVLDKNHSVNLDFFNRIRTYTDDVILATKNQKCPAAFGYGKVYKDYDYLLEVGDDTSIKEGAMDIMLNIYNRLRKVGMIGEGVESHRMEYQYQIDSIDNLPDWGGLINRDMVNEVGGPAAFFPIYGFDALEWLQRVHRHDWKIINYKGLFIHGGKNKMEHPYRDELEDSKNIVGESFGKYHICERMGFQNYNWFANKI